jgi:hypothetical protein
VKPVLTIESMQCSLMIYDRGMEGFLTRQMVHTHFRSIHGPGSVCKLPVLLNDIFEPDAARSNGTAVGIGATDIESHCYHSNSAASGRGHDWFPCPAVLVTRLRGDDFESLMA